MAWFSHVRVVAVILSVAAVIGATGCTSASSSSTSPVVNASSDASNGAQAAVPLQNYSSKQLLTMYDEALSSTGADVNFKDLLTESYMDHLVSVIAGKSKPTDIRDVHSISSLIMGEFRGAQKLSNYWAGLQSAPEDAEYVQSVVDDVNLMWASKDSTAVRKRVEVIIARNPDYAKTSDNLAFLLAYALFTQVAPVDSSFDSQMNAYLEGMGNEWK